MLRNLGLLFTGLCLGLALETTSAQEPFDLEFLGEARLPHGLEFEGTWVGGLSALTYDARREVFYVLSDDKGEHAAPRFYTVRLHLADGRLAADGTEVVTVTTLRQRGGRPYPEGALDPEGLTLTPDGETLWLTSEGDVRNRVAPTIHAFSRQGAHRGRLPLPRRYRPDRRGNRGVRHNAALESAGVSTDGRFFYTAVENALVQDGPKATLEQGSLVRLLRYDLARRRLDGEFFYRTEPVARPPKTVDGFHTNGLVELLALPPELSGECAEALLALERSYSEGLPPGEANTVRLFRICLSTEEPIVPHSANSLRSDTLRPSGNAPDTSPAKGLPRKTLVLDLKALAVPLDNIEGMTLGPALPDGRRTLILVSDDNFGDTQVTQFLALALR